MKDQFLFCAVVVAGSLVSSAAGFAGEKQSATQPSPESDAERSASRGDGCHRASRRLGVRA